MTEQDRGAYTPQSEVPLAFDPRRAPDRSPAPMMLVASFAVLLVLVAALFMALRHGGHRSDAPVRPVGAPLGGIKSAPPVVPSARDASQGVDVFAAQNVPSSAPRAPAFAPPPEAPQPRPPAPQLQVRQVTPVPVRILPPAVAVATGSTVIHPGAADRAGLGATPRAAPERSPPRSLAADRAATETLDAALATSRAVPAGRASSSPATVTSGSGVQIGAYSSHALADRGYSDAGALMGGAMAGKAKSVAAVEKDGKTLYRTIITGFADHAAARAFCASLSAKGGRCIVKG